MMGEVPSTETSLNNNSNDNRLCRNNNNYVQNEVALDIVMTDGGTERVK